MSRTLLCLALFAILSPLLANDASPAAGVVVAVVTPDGKPAVGAKVWLYPYTTGADTPKEPKPQVTDAGGKLRVPAVTDAQQARQLFIRDAAERIGSASVSIWERDGAEIKVTLIDTAAVAGRITNHEGKPVAGAVVTPQNYYADGKAQRTPGGPASYFELPVWEQTRLAATTDAKGQFKVRVPVGYRVNYLVKVAGSGETRWYATAGAELETKLFEPGTVAVTATGVDPARLKGVGLRLAASAAEKAESGVSPVLYFNSTFDATGKATVQGIVPGKYTLTIDRDAAIPAIFEPGAAFEVVANKTASVTATYTPAAKVMGKVTDQATGKGVADVQLIVNISDGTGPYPKQQLWVKTDANGVYTAHGPAGWYRPWMQRAPEGYSTPAAPGRELLPAVKVEIGKPHEFAAIALPKSVSFTGRAVLADGKPAVGATVRIYSSIQFDGWAKVTTDKDGNFTIKNLPPDDAVDPRILLGNAVNIPKAFELEKQREGVVFEISEANAAGFKGVVTDAKGTPVAGARVQLRQHVALVGRGSSTGIAAILTTTKTDAAGRYSFTGLWIRDQYNVEINAEGFADGEGKTLVGQAGMVQDFGTVKLARASLSVSGTVVGPDGKPVAGAEVFGVDGPTRFATKSAPDGSFTLTGYYEGLGFAFVRQSGYRLAAIPVLPGGNEKVTIKLVRTDAPPAATPGITADHKAALDKFHRHLLIQFWENRGILGTGRRAIEGMARVDLAIAKLWRDTEKQRTNGRTDYSNVIESAISTNRLFDTAKNDIDEAVALLNAMGPDAAFAGMIQLGEQMLAVDKEKASRLAGEAVVKARQHAIPAKVWKLAQAGDFAIRAGHAAGGKRVLLEAAELAAKLGADDEGANSFAVGMVAARLAPHDWAKAEALLDSIKKPIEYNRHLSNTAARLARTDLAKAKELFGRFKPDNSYYSETVRLQMAYAIAKTKPDEAVKLIESMKKEGYYKFLGYIRLAELLAATDKARSVKLIDTAFDLLDRNPSEYQRWSNYGSRAGLAAVGAVRAKEMGYPDMPALVARALAQRPTGQEAWSPEGRPKALVSFAAALALVDPASARHVLAGIAPPDDFVTRALAQDRDWLFALALADPPRATELVDKLIDRAKNARGQNGLSGLSELSSILIAADTLKTLALYGNLPREISDDGE